VSLKELKDTVLLLAKQMVELKEAMIQREEIATRSSEDPLGSLPDSDVPVPLSSAVFVFSAMALE